MKRCITIVLAAVVGLVAVPVAFGQSTTKEPAAKIEFRWLETMPVKNLTDDKGIQTTCAEDLCYPHRKPILTNNDVAGTTLTNSDFSASGLPGDHFMINFQLKKEARQALVEACGEMPARQLAVFVDGKYWGTSYFRKGEADTFAPHAGFISSQAEAERIVQACKKS